MPLAPQQTKMTFAEWHFFDRRTLVATPWKNGGGVTREIVCQPPGADLTGFDWRVSIAHIASDGPFSAFPGVDRVITLLDGAGVQLDSADGHVSHGLDTPWRPFAFAGEAPIHSRLLGGPCDDFNVMTRRGVCRASVQVLRASAAGPALPLGSPPAGLCMVLQGAWSLAGPAPRRLSEGQGLWWAGVPGGGPVPAAPALRAEAPDAVLLWVAVEPHSVSNELKE